MPTPSKTISLLRKHESKAMKERREQSEKELSSSKSMKSCAAVRSDPVAFAHYRRVYSMLTKAGMNDALIENVINRYCLMQSECAKAEAELARYHAMMQEIMDRKEEMEFTKYVTAVQEMARIIQTTDKTLTTKRKMLLDIEDKNALTIASKLRSIPKKAAEEAPDEMAGFLARRRDG